MKRTTLALSDGDVAKLRDIAEQLGYLADSGPTVGNGSISKLMRAIADGEVEVTQPQHDAPTRRFLGL